MEKTVKCPECEALFPVDIPEPEKETKESGIKEFLRLTKDDEKAPKEKDFAAMKEKWGDVYIFPFNERFQFVYRPVFGTEYENILKGVMQFMGDKGSPMEAERELASQLIQKCVLYPKITPTFKESMPSGITQTLSSLIHLVSGFFSQDQVTQMVIEA